MRINKLRHYKAKREAEGTSRGRYRNYDPELIDKIVSQEVNKGNDFVCVMSINLFL